MQNSIDAFGAIYNLENLFGPMRWKYIYLFFGGRLGALSKGGVYTVAVPVYRIARTLKCFVKFSSQCF